MVDRIFDANLIAPAIKHFLRSDAIVDPIEWISNPDNIVLLNDEGDMALFEKGIKEVYSGHYYFQSRGRKAITSGLELLDELLNSCYNIKVLTGLVPIEHLGARWMSRRLGFTSHGVCHLNDKHFELFILTKKEFNR
jgi:hypothetical protein